MKIHKTVHTKSGRIDKRKNTGGKLFMAEYKKAAKKAATERRKKERQAERQAASARKARERDVAKKTRERERESCLLYTSPSPRDPSISRMPSSA